MTVSSLTKFIHLTCCKCLNPRLSKTFLTWCHWSVVYKGSLSAFMAHQMWRYLTSTTEKKPYKQTNKKSTITMLRNPALGGSSMGRAWNDHGTGGYWHQEHSAKWIKSSSLIKSAVFAINNTDREQNVRDLLHFAIFSMQCLKKKLFQFNNGSLRNVLDMLICVTIDWAAVIWFLCAHFSSASAAEGYTEFVGDCLGTSSNVGYIVCCCSLSHIYLNNRK